MRDLDSDIDDSEDSNDPTKSANTYNDGKHFNKNKISDPSLEFYQ
jgi:hypothetical protein